MNYQEAFDIRARLLQEHSMLNSICVFDPFDCSWKMVDRASGHVGNRRVYFDGVPEVKTILEHSSKTYIAQVYLDQQLLRWETIESMPDFCKYVSNYKETRVKLDEARKKSQVCVTYWQYDDSIGHKVVTFVSYVPKVFNVKVKVIDGNRNLGYSLPTYMRDEEVKMEVDE